MKFNQWLVENKKKSVEAKKEFVKSVMDKYGKKCLLLIKKDILN